METPTYEMENLFFLLSIIAVLSIYITLFIFRKRIQVFFYKLMYGSYSYRYLSTLPESLREAKYPPPFWFEPRLIIRNFLKQSLLPSYQTTENIHFQGHDIGKSYPDFFKNNGKPDYISISENDDSVVKLMVAGYNEKLYNYECVVLYFFWNQLLVAGQYQVRRDNQKILSSDLAVKLWSKYHIRVGSSSYNDFKLHDNHGNEIFFQDNGFSIDVSIYRPELNTYLQSVGSFAPAQKKMGVQSAAVLTF